MHIVEKLYWIVVGIMVAIMTHELGRGITWAGIIVPIGIMLFGYIAVFAHRMIIHRAARAHAEQSIDCG